MELIPFSRGPRKNNLSRAAGVLSTVARVTNDMGLTKQALDMYKDLSNKRAAQRKPQPRKQQTVNQRSVKMQAPTSFGISSNDVVRAVVKRSTPTMARMSGVSYLGAIQSGSNSSSFPMVALFTSSNPITFQDRLQIHASTYDKYVYNSVRLKYVPAVGTSTSGKVCIAIDRDYSDPPQSTNWGETISYESVASGTVWSEHSCMMKRDPSEKRSYFTNLASGLDLRETEQFKFYAYIQGVPVNTFCGDLYLEYDIELVSPVYAPSELNAAFTRAGTFTTTASVLNSAPSNVWTISGLPSSDQKRPIYEVVFNVAPNTTNIQFGSATGADRKSVV